MICNTYINDFLNILGENNQMTNRSTTIILKEVESDTGFFLILENICVSSLFLGNSNTLVRGICYKQHHTLFFISDLGLALKGSQQ